jgi:CBS domain-containing protein
MVAADVGRVPILDRKTSHLVGLVSRKDLLRIRATAKLAEANREAYFARRTAAIVPEQEPA